MKHPNLSLSLADTVASAKHLELPADMVEFGIDQALNNEVLKDVPFVGWIAKGLSIYTGISDQIFFNKLLRFLTQLEALGAEEKEAFAKKVKEEPEFRRKVGERLIVAVERLDDPGKTEMLAKVFDCFLVGLLTYEEFSEFAHIIDRAFLGDLQRMQSGKSPDFFDYTRLLASGLASFGVVMGESREDPGQIGYGLSKVGKRLQHVLRGTYPKYLEEERRLKNWGFAAEFAGKKE